MRKITAEIVGAFERRESRAKSNTWTDGERLYLFDNLIAEHRDDGIYISLAGWDTVTTRERLNGIRGAHVHRDKGQTKLNNVPMSDYGFHLVV